MYLAKLSPYLLTVCLFLLFPAYTYAHDKTDTTQDTSDTTDDNHRFEIGLGVQFLDDTIMDRRQDPNSIFLELGINYSYRLTSFYRIGIENRFDYCYLFFYGDILLFTHEFDIFRMSIFTFQARVGIGLAWYFVDGRTDYEVHFPNKHKFAVPLNFGFGIDLRLSRLISLKLALGITDNMIFYTHNNNKVALHVFEKDSYSFKNGIGGDVSIRIGFHF